MFALKNKSRLQKQREQQMRSHRPNKPIEEPKPVHVNPDIKPMPVVKPQPKPVVQPKPVQVCKLLVWQLI